MNQTLFFQELEDFLRGKTVANFVPVSLYIPSEPVQVTSRFKMILNKNRREFQISDFVLYRKLFEDTIWLFVIEGKPICYA